MTRNHSSQPGSWSRIITVLVVCAMVLSYMAFPTFAAQVTPIPSSIQNGGFETNPLTASQQNSTVANITGWCSSVNTQSFEIWRNGFNPPATGGGPFYSNSGNFFAELNVDAPTAIYQDLQTTKGALYKWSLWHSGRSGTDTAQLKLGDPSTTLAVAKKPDGTYLLTDAKKVWGNHIGYYCADSGTTRFRLEAVSTAGNVAGQGNFVDDISFVKVADPTTQTIYVGDPDPASSTLAAFTPDGAGMTSDYADPILYTDGFAPPTLGVSGSYQVKVEITDDQNNVVGYIVSIINVLELGQATVTVNWVDEGGNSLKSTETTPYTLGASYDIPGYSTGQEVTFDGKIYLFKELDSSSDQLSGQVDTNKNITFVFEPKPQTVTVQYEDSNGQPIGTPDVSNHDNGDPYSVQTYDPGDEIVIDGHTYLFVEVKPGSDPPSGTVDADKVITLVLEPKGYTVTINYVDENGTPLQSPNVGNYADGDPYTVNEPSGDIVINGVTYVYKQLGISSDPLTGTMDTDKNIIFVLAPKPQTVTVQYEDSNGQPIGTPDVSNHDNGDSYSVQTYNPGDEIVIDGYTYLFVEVKPGSDPPSGTVDADKVITFVLEPKGYTVTINYVDENGTSLQSPNVGNYADGDPYTVNEPSGDIVIDGVTYVYKQLGISSDPLTGTMDTNKNIIFVLIPKPQPDPIDPTDPVDPTPDPTDPVDPTPTPTPGSPSPSYRSNSTGTDVPDIDRRSGRDNVVTIDDSDTPLADNPFTDDPDNGDLSTGGKTPNTGGRAPISLMLALLVTSGTTIALTRKKRNRKNLK